MFLEEVDSSQRNKKQISTPQFIEQWEWHKGKITHHYKAHLACKNFFVSIQSRMLQISLITYVCTLMLIRISRLMSCDKEGGKIEYANIFNNNKNPVFIYD